MSKIWSCNIDRRGRWLRAIFGVLIVALALWLWFGTGDRFWSVGLFLLGCFALFEGIRGWCVLRAMGFNTPV